MWDPLLVNFRVFPLYGDPCCHAFLPGRFRLEGGGLVQGYVAVFLKAAGCAPSI